MESQPKLGKTNWPVSYGGRERLDQLLDSLPEPIRRDLGRTAVWAHLHKEPLVRFLAARLLSRAELFLNDLDAPSASEGPPFPSLKTFLTAVEKLVLMLSRIRALPCDETVVHDCLNEFLSSFD